MFTPATIENNGITLPRDHVTRLGLFTLRLATIFALRLHQNTFQLEVDWQFGNGNLFHLTLERRLAGLSLAFLSTFGDALPSLPILPWSTHHDIVPVANIFLTSSRQLPVNNPIPTLRALFARQSLFDVLLQYTIERDTQMRFQSHQGTTCCGIEASVPMPCLSINATNSLSFLGQNVKQSRPTKGNSATPLSTPFFKGLLRFSPHGILIA